MKIKVKSIINDLDTMINIVTTSLEVTDVTDHF